MIYLISPYGDPDPAVMLHRFRAAAWACARFAHRGIKIFSPIVHGHPISVESNKRKMPPIPLDYWYELDEELLRASEKAFVLMLKGWEDSVGVKKELGICDEISLLVLYLDMRLTFQEPDHHVSPIQRVTRLKDYDSRRGSRGRGSTEE